jgi:hypothetical protein
VSAQGTLVDSPSSSSALSAPAEKLATSTSSEVFGSIASKATPAPVRATRTRRTQPLESSSAVPAPLTRTTRRTVASSNVAAPAPLQKAASLPTVAPIVRSARRPLRKTASDEPVSAAVEEQSSEETQSTASSEEVAPAPPPRPILSFNPPPCVTQGELSRITQRNTKKNQQLFNKLKIETLFLDYDRPPSPTSKIRRLMDKEGAAGRPSTKEGREARAAKRRNALRASVDGSEVAAFSAELGESTPPAPSLMEHYRAPGDDEQYETPMRSVGVLVSKKGAAAGRTRTSAGSAAASPASRSTEVKESRRVKWDKALVYEGPKEDALPPTSDGILKVRLLFALLPSPFR